MGICCSINKESIHDNSGKKSEIKLAEIKINSSLEEKTDDLETLKKADYTINEFSLKDNKMYGKPVYVYDGDTLHIVFKINNNLVKFNCRMMGIDSPEIVPKNISDKAKRDAEIKSAIKSRNYLIEKITNQTYQEEKVSKQDIKEFLSKCQNVIWVHCLEFDKYGRLLVEIYKNPSDKISINQQMINDKMALSYDGGTKTKFDESNFKV